MSHNSFTDVGVRWMWEMMTGLLRKPDGTLTDELASARLLVGNGDQSFAASDTRLAGDQTAQAALDDGYPEIEQGDGECRLLLCATFDEKNGAFDWQERGVVTAQGVLLDRSVTDQGRKVLGAVWKLEAALVLNS